MALLVLQVEGTRITTILVSTNLSCAPKLLFLHMKFCVAFASTAVLSVLRIKPGMLHTAQRALTWSGLNSFFQNFRRDFNYPLIVIAFKHDLVVSCILLCLCVLKVLVC